MTELGQWQVHHIAFPSTFIQAKTAKALDLKRRKDVALINISVLNKQDKKPLKAILTGTAKNLLGQLKELEFIEVDEGDAVYYLAQISYSNEEVWRFKVDIKTPDGQTQTLKFKQKFYVD